MITIVGQALFWAGKYGFFSFYMGHFSLSICHLQLNINLQDAVM